MQTATIQICTNIEGYEDEIIELEQVLLDILLKDKTTNQNIIWATNDYSKLGIMYKANCEITKFTSKVIEPRVTKAKNSQSNRTREKAEVFTPSWICNEQNNLVDEQWFNKKNVFNTQKNKSWYVNNNKIEFSNDHGRTWKDYVDARRMEITCGEAPYLVSGYDTVTGKKIELKDRIGLLDRKLRIVNENVDDESDWFRWVERAFQSIYAFEYQGDNLLKARQNLLSAFIENKKFKFNSAPTLDELKKIAMIIIWNVWQMDGITFTVPYGDMRLRNIWQMKNNLDKTLIGDIRERTLQLSWLDSVDNAQNIKRGFGSAFSKQTYCKIKDWRSNKTVKYISLLKGEN